MEQERPFLDELIEVAVYAPIGLVLTAVEDLPALIEKGRRRVAGQLGAARFVGRFALRNARRRLDDLLEPSGTEATVTVLRTPTPPAVKSSPPAGELAIPGYDALAASQVVARLDALEPDELAAVEAHELAGRRRRTILNRIAQLRG